MVVSQGLTEVCVTFVTFFIFCTKIIQNVIHGLINDLG